MKIKIAFICIGNSCRSQIAEGFARQMGKELLDKKIEIYSAGTHPAYGVSPDAVAVMEEKGIDITSQYPKTISEIPTDPDIVITMGCGVECPYLPSSCREDWGIEDPVDMPVEFFREVRDIIEPKVKYLIDSIRDSDSLEEVIEKLKPK